MELKTYVSQQLLRGVTPSFFDFKICSPVVLPLSIQYRQLLTHFLQLKTVQHLISGKVSAFTKVFF
jgi:hypothetical protein